MSALGVCKHFSSVIESSTCCIPGALSDSDSSSVIESSSFGLLCFVGAVAEGDIIPSSLPSSVIESI